MDWLYSYISVFVSTAIATVAFSYYYFAGGPAQKPRAKLGVLIGEKKEGESQILRNFRSVEKLASNVEKLQTLHETFQRSRKLFATRPCLGARKHIKTHTQTKVIKGEEKKWFFYEFGPYKWETYEEVGKRIDNFASGLISLGLEEKSNLAIYSDTRPEWTIASFAAFSQSIVVLTVYANLGKEPMIHALNEGKVTHMVTNGELIPGLIPIIKSVKTLSHIIYTDKCDEKAEKAIKEHGIQLFSFSDIENKGKEAPVAPKPPKGDDVAVIMYTSGSTGMPKGVMITHNNVIGAITGVLTMVQITSNDVHLTYLPLAHILAFILEIGCITMGASLGAGNPRTLNDSAMQNCKGDITELRPTFLVGVPGVYDKIKAGISSRIEKGGKLQKFLFNLAYQSKKAAKIQGKDTPIWNFLLFNKFKTAIGGRVRFIVSGGAPLSSECCEYLSVLFGAPVVQGYGLTETCGCSTFLELDSLDINASSVGAPSTTTEIKLVDCKETGYISSDNPPKGEIWIRGLGVSLGYYKNEEKTKEEFTRDGWFKTGDIGVLNANGTISIIDRKKNLVKPPHGEYIAVERLESIYKNSPLVSNIMVYASSKYNELIAFIQPNKGNLESKVNLSISYEKICESKEAHKAVLQSLNEVWQTNSLKSIERISAVKLFHEEWTPENGWLTAAAKIRRQQIHQERKQEIEEVYKNLASS